MEIRTIAKNDYSEVDQLIREAFTKTDNSYGNESELVDKIRTSIHYKKELEIIALKNDVILGHGLLSEV